MPKSDKIVLQKIVYAYDNLIDSVYNGEVEKFLEEATSKQLIIQRLDKYKYCELVSEYNRSTLAHKNKNMKFDSVYLSKNGNIITIKPKEDIDEVIDFIDEEIEILAPGQTIEDKIEEYKTRGYWKFISESSFKGALLKISEDKSEIKEYIDVLDITGYIDPKTVVNSIRQNEIDENDYFIKRIIAIEFYIKLIREKYGC